MCVALLTLPATVVGQALGQTPTTVAEARQTVDSLREVRAKPGLVAEAWRALGEAHQRNGEVDSALTAYRQAVRMAELLPDQKQKADILSAMGSQLLRANMNDSALGYVQRARDLRFSLGDTLGASRLWNNTGSAHYQLGNYEQALTAFSQALAGRRQERDSVGIARVLTNIGKVYQDWGQHDRAEARLREAVAEARRSGNPAILGYALNTLAQVYVDRRQFALAYRTVDSSMAAYSSKSPLVAVADSIGGWRLNAAVRGEALLKEGRSREAIAVLDSVAAVGKENGNIRSQARSLMLLGQAYAQLGELVRARELLSRSVELSQSVEQRVFMLQGLENLSLVEERAGNATASLRALRAATALRDTIFNRSTAERLAAEETREERERQRAENERLRDEQRAQAAVIDRQKFTVSLVLVILLLGGLLVLQLVRFNRLGRAREDALARKNEELSTALTEVRTLTGLIPICASCKRVRDDRGYWQAVESYISSHSDAEFSHAICQSCGPVLYGDLWPEHPEPSTGTTAPVGS
jgi:tetratricopeptide (TPR) repeat protein